MYKNEFDNLLKQNTLPHSIMLYGINRFFIDYYAKSILKKISNGGNILKLLYSDYKFESAKSHLQSGSLFDDFNILYIEVDKKIPKEEIKSLIELAAKSKIHYFILKYLLEDNKECMQISKLFIAKNSGCFVRFFEPNLGESISVLSNHAKKIDVDISNDIINYILTIHNNDLSLAFSDIDKLAIYNKKITIDLVNSSIYGSGEIDLDQFYNDFLLKKSILKTVEQIQERNIDEIVLVTGLRRYLQDIFMFHSYAKVYGTIDSKAILGYKLPLQIERKRAEIAMRLSTEQFFKLFKTLESVELELKQGLADKNSLFLSSLIEIKTKIL